MNAELLQTLPPRQALRTVTAELEAAGVPDAAFDAGVLFQLAAGQSVHLCGALTAQQAEMLAELTARRAAREPLQYLCGEWDFLDFTLKVGPGVLCPRADTEVVCEAALDALKAMAVPQPVVLDLCAGTGCLGLGIKRFCPQAQVTCVELYDEALAYLRYNAAHALPNAQVEVRQADVFTLADLLPEGSVDLIVSNPPYLTGQEMQEQMPETAREPATALDGGEDGLAFYRVLTSRYRRVLRPGGVLVLEIGWQQAEDVLALGKANGWCGGTVRKDYGGNNRAVILQNEG